VEATVIGLVLKSTYLFAVIVCVNFRTPELLLELFQHLLRIYIVTFPLLSYSLC